MATHRDRHSATPTSEHPVSGADHPRRRLRGGIATDRRHRLGTRQTHALPDQQLRRDPRQIITRYTGRNGIEDSLGSGVNFFPLDCLASEVPLNADLDVASTVVANGCYRWLASELDGFTAAKPKRLCRKIIETGGTVRVTADEIHVHFEKHAHNPILRQAVLDAKAGAIPWAGGKRLRFTYASTD